MIKNREELKKFRKAAAAAYEAQSKKLIVCGGTGCVAGGSLKIHGRLKELLEQQGIGVEVELQKEPHDGSVGLKKSGCHGFCEMGPLLRIEPQGWLYSKVKLEDCEEIIEKTVKAGECITKVS